MDQPVQNDRLSEKTPSEPPQPVAAEQPVEGLASKEQSLQELPISKETRRMQFVAGFLGWFLLNGLVWMLFLSLGEGYFVYYGGLITFPANVILLIVLVLRVRTHYVGFGLLTAIGLNLLVSLLLGFFINGVCLIPFVNNVFY